MDYHNQFKKGKFAKHLYLSGLVYTKMSANGAIFIPPTVHVHIVVMLRSHLVYLMLINFFSFNALLTALNV